MSLRKKIIIGYGIAFTLLVLVLFWAIVNLYQLGKASNAILKENYRSILAAETMINSLGLQDSAILLMLHGEKNDGLVQFRRNESIFLQWLGRAKDNITIEGEDRIVDSLEKAFNEYLVAFSRMLILNETDSLFFIYYTQIKKSII